MLEDTIAAIITPQGVSSVGIIRISGIGAIAVADQVFRGKSGLSLDARPNYSITYGHVLNEKGLRIDEVLALKMIGPKSFTGEDVIELQSHGGQVVLSKILALVLQAGARLAEPGEFSKRAFLNGRLDLTQAEAIMDLINAKTEKGLEAAANNLSGVLTGRIQEVRQHILDIISYVEADIDFPEEEFTRLAPEDLLQRIKTLQKQLQAVLETYKSGRIIRDGLKTALVGRPNVGKSSLLNALLKEKRAIVTDLPGTTRDSIEEYYNLAGIPLVLIDTAGIRETEDRVEQLGVQKTKEVIAKADLIVYVIDSENGITAEDERLLQELPAEKLLVIVNKKDLLSGQAEEQRFKEALKHREPLFISAKEGTGLAELEKAITHLYLQEQSVTPERIMLTNPRQKAALEKAAQALAAAVNAVMIQLPADFISIDLKQALLFLGEVTGETLGEDIIEQIFSNFCLGK